MIRLSSIEDAVFCLDTNIAIDVMNRRKPHWQTRLETGLECGTRIIIPALVVFELCYGIQKSAFPDRNLDRLRAFLAPISDIPAFDRDDAAEAGDIRAFLDGRGKPVGPYDVLIAAQAHRRGAALVTGNKREFERVPGLIVTDWAN